MALYFIFYFSLFLQNCAYAVVKNNILKKAFDDNFKGKCRK